MCAQEVAQQGIFKVLIAYLKLVALGVVPVQEHPLADVGPLTACTAARRRLDLGNCRMSAYLVFLLAFLIPSFSPGAETAAVVSATLARGPRAAIPLWVGLLMGKLAMLAAALLGVAALVQAWEPAMGILKVGGALWLLVLAVLRWRSAGRLPSQARAGSMRAAGVATGAALTLSNPMAVMFYMTVLPNVLPQGRLTTDAVAVVAVTVVGVTSCMVLLYASVAHLLRSRLAAGSRLADRMAAALFAVAAVLIAIR